MAPIAQNSAAQNPFKLRSHTERPPLDLRHPAEMTPANRAYLDYYGLSPSSLGQGVEYISGAVDTSHATVIGHVFVPVNSIGTIFILHGYFDHAGSSSLLIKAALERGYIVFTYDLPGHGLSSGEPGATGGIRENARLLNEIATKYSNQLTAPVYLIGFSTGGSIALENMIISNRFQFEQTVLVSPLLHHTHWFWGRVGYTLARPFVSGIKSQPRKNSSNISYLQFARQDPLRNRFVSFDFLKDIYHWNRHLKNIDVDESSMLVIQGDADAIVDWRYNLPLLKRKFKGIQIYMVAAGKHQLFNETETIRNQTFARIFDYLGFNNENRQDH